MRTSLPIVVVIILALASAACSKTYYVTQGGEQGSAEQESAAQPELPAGAVSEPAAGPGLPPGVEVASVRLARLDGTELALEARPLPLRVNVLVQFQAPVEAQNRPAVEAAFALSPEGGPAVSGAFLWNADATVMTFLPTRNLAYQTKYYISLDETIRDFQTMVNSDVDGDGAADLLVGSPDEGRAHILRGGALDASVQKIPGPSPDIRFGAAVAMVGDVNADGYADIAVGAPKHASNKGLVVIYDGALVAKGGDEAIAMIPGDKPGDLFGMSLAGIGDRDEDGYADLLVGISEFSVSPTDRRGRFALYGGKSIAMGSPEAVKAMTGIATLERLGENVAGLGDVDGDAIPDFAVKHRIGPTAEVLIFSGKDLGKPPLRIAAPPMLPSFGSTIAFVPDLDADGRNELLIGAPGEDAGKGRVSLYLGKSLDDVTLPAPTTITETDASLNSFFGSSVAPLRAGSGITLIAGAPERMGGTGHVYGYSVASLAAGDNPKGSYLWAQAGAANFDRFGALVARVGDMNGDQVEDFAVCSTKAPGMSTDMKGKVSIFSGAIPTAPAFHAYSPAAGFCSSISGMSP